MQNATNPPSLPVPYGTIFPNLTANPSITQNTCNSYLPAANTLQRFVAIVNLIAANGLYVVWPPSPTFHSFDFKSLLAFGSMSRHLRLTIQVVKTDNSDVDPPPPSTTTTHTPEL